MFIPYSKDIAKTEALVTELIAQMIEQTPIQTIHIYVFSFCVCFHDSFHASVTSCFCDFIFYMPQMCIHR